MPPPPAPPPLLLHPEEQTRFLSGHLPIRCRLILTLHTHRLLSGDGGATEDQILGLHPSGSYACSAEVIPAATLLWLAWRRARSQGGMLSGKPGYEAQDMLWSRMRASLTEAATPGQWRAALGRRLGIAPEHLLSQRAGEEGWWRQQERTINLYRLRDPALIANHLIPAVKSLFEMEHYLYLPRPDADTDAPETPDV